MASHHFLFTHLAFRLFAYCGVMSVGMALANEAAAQGPLRRIGERIRSNAQQRIAPPLNRPATAPALRPPEPRPIQAPNAAPATAAASANRSTSSLRPYYNSPQRESEAGGTISDYNLPAPAMPRRSSQVSQATAMMPAVPTPYDIAQPRPRLGVVVETPAPRLVPGRASRPTPGALLTAVDPGSSAEAAGLLPGDRIVAIDGRMVVDVNGFVSALSTINPGDQMDVKFIRNEKLTETTVTIAGQNRTVDKSVDIAANSLPDLGNSILLRNPQPGSVTTTPAGDQQGDSPVMEGFGKALGWLQGANAKGTAQSGPLGEVDPMAFPADEFEPLAERQLDPLPVDEVNPKSDSELLPPPLADPIENVPPTENIPENTSDQAELFKPSLSDELESYESLMKEVEELRQRIKVFEAMQRSRPK